MIEEYISYGLIAVLCLFCIISDLRKGIIPNRYLCTFGGCAVLIHIVGVILHPPEGLNIYLMTITIAVCFSMLLYFTNTWAGGDCKLYIVLICAMPVSVVQTEIRGISLVFWIVIIAFLIGYIYLIIYSFKERIDEYRKNTLNKADITKIGASLKQSGPIIGKRFLGYLQVFFFLTFANYFIQMFLDLLEKNAGFVLGDSFFISYTLWPPLLFVIDILVLYLIQKAQLLSSKWFSFAIIAADFFLGIIDLKFFLNIWNYLIWISVCATWIIKGLVEKYNYEEISIIDVQKGMILSTASSLLLYSLDRSNTLRISDESLKYRLSETESEKIHIIGKKNPNIASVEIVRKVPFAAFLGLAVLLIIFYERGM